MKDISLVKLKRLLSKLNESNFKGSLINYHGGVTDSISILDSFHEERGHDVLCELIYLMVPVLLQSLEQVQATILLENMLEVESDVGGRGRLLLKRILLKICRLLQTKESLVCH